VDACLPTFSGKKLLIASEKVREGRKWYSLRTFSIILTSMMGLGVRTLPGDESSMLFVFVCLFVGELHFRMFKFFLRAML